jgi:hypothetical protein
MLASTYLVGGWRLLGASWNNSLKVNEQVELANAISPA